MGIRFSSTLIPAPDQEPTSSWRQNQQHPAEVPLAS